MVDTMTDLSGEDSPFDQKKTAEFIDVGLRFLVDTSPHMKGGKWVSESDGWTREESEARIGPMRSLWENLSDKDREICHELLLFIYRDGIYWDIGQLVLIDVPRSWGGTPRRWIAGWTSKAPIEWPSLWGWKCSWCEQVFTSENTGVCPGCGHAIERTSTFLQWHTSLRGLLSTLKDLKAKDHEIEMQERPGRPWVGFIDRTQGIWHRYRYGKRGTSRWKEAYRTPEARKIFFSHRGKT